MNHPVTVAMAIYKPQMYWLREELISLHRQTFQNFELAVWNDDPDDDYDYVSFFCKNLPNIQCRFFHGEINLGSTGAFAQLTQRIGTNYIAYCDQDDIWEPDKLQLLYDYMCDNTVNMVCSDMYVIDQKSHVLSDSITTIRPHYFFYHGNNPFKYLLAKNFVTGCTMMVKTEIAQKALHFPKEITHDWWIALCASASGKIGVINKPLIQYRIHDTNQTLILKGVVDKKSYYTMKILMYERMMQIIERRFGNSIYRQDIQRHGLWAQRRKSYFKNPTFLGGIYLWRMRSINKNITYFELFLPCMPGFLFSVLVKMIQNGKL